MICLTQPYDSTRKRVIADSWFGSVKSAVQLLKKGLHSIMLVKTAHKQFSMCLLGQKTLEMGQWVAYTATVNDKVQACQFRDLKLKEFFSTCSSSIAGKPRKTKQHGMVPHPRDVEEYLKYSASTDVHNHYHTRNVGLKDIWHTQSPHR